MIRGARLLIHTSWDVPAGTKIDTWVPVMVNVASPRGLIKVQILVLRLDVLKSSETIFDWAEAEPIEERINKNPNNITQIDHLLFIITFFSFSLNLRFRILLKNFFMFLLFCL